MIRNEELLAMLLVAIDATELLSDPRFAKMEIYGPIGKPWEMRYKRELAKKTQQIGFEFLRNMMFPLISSLR